MIWQDTVIGTGQVLFSIALVPAMFSAHKPPRITCALTGAVLFCYTVTFSTLGLWWATVTAAACATCWAVLLVQRRR